jgi:Na+/melibiose symporter-like transporter
VGLIAQRFGAEAAIAMDALSFVASFALLLPVRAPGLPVQPTEPHRTLAGLRFILKTPVLRMLTLLLAAETVVSAATLDLFTFHLKSTLGQSDYRVGVMFAVASVGAIGGSVCATRAKRRLGLHWTYVLTAGALAVALGLAPFARTFLVTATAAVIYTFNRTLRAILSMSRRQEVTPDAMLGRVTATFWLVLDSTRFVGAAVVGRIASGYGADVAFGLVSASLFVLALATVPARSLRDDPAR